MSWNPLITIKTKDDKKILSCEFITQGLESFEIWNVLDNLVQQGLAAYLEGWKWDGYPSVIDIPQATGPVVSVLIPAIETVFKYDNAVYVSRISRNIAAAKGDLQDQEEWEKHLEYVQKKNIAALESLKAIQGEGLIIELWGHL